jgi:CheY-like chemotaxis protein
LLYLLLGSTLMTNKPRRQHTQRRPRIKVSWPVTVKVDNRVLHGKTLDVSSFGVKVRLDERLDDTTIVTLHLEPTHGTPLDLHAILWRTDDDGPVFFFLKKIPEILVQNSSKPSKILAEPPGKPSPPSRVSSILVVDDDPDIGAFVQAALESEGYLVRVTADPLEAVRMAKRGSSEIDLLLIDVVMPMMDGRELVHRMRTLRPNLKVMFMSGYEMAGLSAMGWPIISKPFGLAELTEKVAEAMSSSRPPSAFAAPRVGARRPSPTAQAT